MHALLSRMHAYSNQTCNQGLIIVRIYIDRLSWRSRVGNVGLFPVGVQHIWNDFMSSDWFVCFQNIWHDERLRTCEWHSMKAIVVTWKGHTCRTRQIVFKYCFRRWLNEPSRKRFLMFDDPRSLHEKGFWSGPQFYVRGHFCQLLWLCLFPLCFTKLSLRLHKLFGLWASRKVQSGRF